jgi:midasin (ATPase involved in ribosome maturation)
MLARSEFNASLYFLISVLSHTLHFQYRYLNPNMRSRFTEFFVGETTEPDELAIIVKNYLQGVDAERMKSILEFYRDVCTSLPRKYR